MSNPVIKMVSGETKQIQGFNKDGTSRFVYTNYDSNPSTGILQLSDVIVTPNKNGSIDSLGNIYKYNNGIHRINNRILGEIPVSNTDPVGKFFVESYLFGRLLNNLNTLRIEPIEKIARESVTNKYLNKLISPAYNYIDSRLGYYSNNRLYNTLGRRFNLKTGPQHPELIRKIKSNKILFDESGNVIISDPSVQQSFIQNRTNFTIDRPVVSHKWGSWDDMDAYIINPKSINNKKVYSIEPSDVIIEGNFHVPTNQVTLISGNPNMIKQAKDNGITYLTSTKLQKLYKQMQDWEQKTKKLSYFDQLKAGKLSRTQQAKNYADEIQRLQSLRGTPTIQDMKFIENKYGLKSGTIPIDQMPDYQKQFNILNTYPLNQISSFLNKNPSYFKYPDGRYMDISRIDRELNYINRSKYNKLFYNPVSPIDSELFP